MNVYKCNCSIQFHTLGCSRNVTVYPDKLIFRDPNMDVQVVVTTKNGITLDPNGSPAFIGGYCFTPSKAASEAILAYAQSLPGNFEEL